MDTFFVDVPVSVPDNLKARADKYEINVAETIRESLEGKIWAIRDRTLDENIRRLQKELAGKITPEEVVATVRESRDGR